MPPARLQVTGPVGAYEYALILVQSFAVHADQDDFAVIEAALFSEIFDREPEFGTDYWSKRLASDLWCFVARYAYAPICGHHVDLLVEAYLASEEDGSGGGDDVYLKTLLHRLSGLLSAASRDKVCFIL